MVSCCFEVLDVSISLRRNVMAAYEFARARKREIVREERQRGKRRRLTAAREEGGGRGAANAGLISIRSVRRQR